MNQVPPLWVTLVTPVATLLGTMLIVVLGVYLQNRALERAIDLLRAKVKQYHAELKLELLTRIGQVEEQRGLIRER